MSAWISRPLAGVASAASDRSIERIGGKAFSSALSPAALAPVN